MKFRELLTHYRKSKGLSKTELSKKIGVKSAYIMNIESGYHKKPTTIKLTEKIADALDLNDREKTELLQASALERIPQDDRAIIEELLQARLASHSKLSKDIIEALQDPVAVKALLVTHKNSEDIKVAIRHMLDCFPSLSTDKRQAILALCK